LPVVQIVQKRMVIVVQTWIRRRLGDRSERFRVVQAGRFDNGSGGGSIPTQNKLSLTLWAERSVGTDLWPEPIPQPLIRRGGLFFSRFRYHGF
jgi:hypothetical protein